MARSDEGCAYAGCGVGCLAICLGIVAIIWALKGFPR